MRQPRGDRGSGTVLVLGLVAVALVLATTLVGLGQVVAGRARAQTAADLAALAAATRLQTTADIGDACDLAGQVAARNGADLAGCAHEGGGVVQVTVAVPTPSGPTRTSARAGPSSAR
ncbi:MAG: flp pilus-assembly TadE/G-like family protein [Micrococcales bacterium]|nr:flp pilus-assembly TadE/G-like family protein [Micrococcales bacterium]